MIEALLPRKHQDSWSGKHLFPAFICLLMAAPIHSLQWQGRLTDPAFQAAESIRLEVLETGDSLYIESSAPFIVELPDDSLWNVCFTTESLEKCYELLYRGRDSVFQVDIGGDAVLVIREDSATLERDTSFYEIDLDSQPQSEEQAAAYFAEEEATQVDKVVMRVRRRPQRTLGKSTISSKSIKRMPSLAEADVIRSIQALPGVVASSDFSTKIYVRGGSSDQNLFLFDNATVYSPVHFFGLFSTFLVEGIDEVDFYKGGFAPEYGNRLASVVDIKSRKGGSDTTDSWFQGSSLKISTFASQFHTEGHQGPVRWLMAGRATYIREVLRLLRDFGLTDLDINYIFYDLQGNVEYNLGKDHSLQISGYFGDDKLDFTPVVLSWGNKVFPINHRLRISPDLLSEATFAYSLFQQEFGLENIFELYNDIENYNYKHKLIYTGLEDHEWTGGLDIKRLKVNFTQRILLANVEQGEEPVSWLYSAFAQDKWSIDPWVFTFGLRANYQNLLEQASLEPRLSAAWEFHPGQSLEFHIGQYYQYVNSIQFADMESLNESYFPALKGTRNTVPASNSLLFSLGYISRDFAPVMNRVGEGLGISALGRWMGMDGKLDGSWSASLEGYYKTLNDMLVFYALAPSDSVRNSVESEIADFFVTGEGYSLGWETSLKKEDGLIFGGANFAQGFTVFKEAQDERAFYPKWHQALSFKGDGGINWRGKDGIWGQKSETYFRSSTQLKFATGLPYTEITGWMPSHLIDQGQGDFPGGPAPIYSENQTIFPGNRNSSFVPYYLRWDIKPVDWGKPDKWNFSLTILNVTNHENVFQYFYDEGSNPPEKVTIAQFPFFPMLLSYEYYF